MGREDTRVSFLIWETRGSSNAPTATDDSLLVLRFEAVEEVWVRIWGDGRVLFEQTVAAGFTSRNLQARSHFQVTSGKPHGLRYWFQGEALGENGILEGASEGQVFFDLSTNSPTMIRRLHEECAARGVTLLDSPVSGGTYGASAGTLAVMVGGDKPTFDRFKPTLEAIGTHVVYCGDIGNGSVCKICNNLMSMGTGVLLAEALTLGVKAGVDLDTLADVINNSTGGSKRLKDKFPLFLFQGNFEPGFATALAAKDVRLATDLGREYGIPMELSNLVDQRHVEALFRGYGPEDSDAVAKIQEEKSGIQLRLHN